MNEHICNIGVIGQKILTYMQNPQQKIKRYLYVLYSLICRKK